MVPFWSRCQHGASFYGRLPFLKEKTSDELTYTQDVIEFLSHMGTKSSYYEHIKYININLPLKWILDCDWSFLFAISFLSFCILEVAKIFQSEQKFSEVMQKWKQNECTFKKMNAWSVCCVAGCLMRVPDAKVRRHIVECVKSFYSCVAPKELPDGTDCHLQPKTRTFPSDSRFTKLSLSEVP